MSFTFNIVQEKDGILIVQLSGRLIDKNEAIELINEMEELGEQPLKMVIDLSGMQYMNSSGLNVLITILTKARKTGGEAIIANEPDIIKKLLVITKLNQVFSVAESTEKALQELRK